jgi:hypothetical protein
VSGPAPDRARRARLWLAGALVLCLFPLMPRLGRSLREQLRLPATPVDRTHGEWAREWLFLESCQPFLPSNARFTVLAADADTEMALYMMAIGLFPAGQPVPHTYYRMPHPEQAAAAQYSLEYRKSAPENPRARLIARVPDGAIYERPPTP